MFLVAAAAAAAGAAGAAGVCPSSELAPCIRWSMFNKQRHFSCAVNRAAATTHTAARADDEQHRAAHQLCFSTRYAKCWCRSLSENKKGARLRIKLKKSIYSIDKLIEQMIRQK